MPRKKLSNRELCRYYDICWYEDDRNPGKYFFTTTVGTAADKQADKLNVIYPLGDSEQHVIELAVEILRLRELYENGVRCYD